jgi:hypothetical protein
MLLALVPVQVVMVVTIIEGLREELMAVKAVPHLGQTAV